ncbi:DUF2075 domain-containing protein [Novosphingobium sp.]|uniref:DUF2075 domain-containing protein n=1 Tax=Novosphingobium sp. TaxID=1874826 RepID=UPI003B52FDA7
MRAYYSADRDRFYADSPSHILGELTRWHHFDVEAGQRQAWLKQIELLRSALAATPVFTLYFEFAIPRMGRRADVVVIIGNAIFVLEFKEGQSRFDAAGIEQVEDYALDLKNFHEGSHGLAIYPILVPTEARLSRNIQFELAFDHVARPFLLCPADLGPIMQMIGSRHCARDFRPAAWEASGYRPTPTIIQAATALYARHNVADITRNDAGDINLICTEAVVTRAIEACRNHGEKAICFITGVPGAGKTLAGLNIATRRSERQDDEHATFLSGNGPLVDVLREALVRDHRARTGGQRSAAERHVQAFIQNIHHFRDEYVHSDAAPSDHVVIFDEAQRAWNERKAAAFMRQKRGIADFAMSEPEFLLGVMDRHADWCTIICLVGGGQEINDGEAGLSEWMAALETRFAHWRVYTSDRIDHPDYDLNQNARRFLTGPRVSLCPDLHLGVSMRSFRAETLSDFISHVVDGDADAARAAHAELAHYPIVLTRDLAEARSWLKGRARGSERYGLVASSGALRLKAEGLNVKAAIDPPNWFLNARDDVRSSYYMEDVASEFDVQGLELDWTGVCWDADLRHDGVRWQSYKFKGTRWQSVHDRFVRLYLKNAYRVVLTRARQGMVIYVPKGDDDDPTRVPGFYDGIFDFLRRCGLPILTSETPAVAALQAATTLPLLPVRAQP